MFTAAPNIHTIRFAQRGLLLLCIGIVAGPTRAQNQGVFGPPAIAPDAAASVGVVPATAKSTGVGSISAQVDMASIQDGPLPNQAARPETPSAGRTLPKRDSRLLGKALQAERPVALVTGDTEADASPTGSMGRTAWATALVLGLIMIVATVVRAVARRQGGLRAALGAGGRAPGGLLEVLGRFPVGRGQTLVLLKLDQRVLLVSQSSGGRLGAGMNTLCEVADPDEVASILIKSRGEGGDSVADRFRSMLAGHSSAASLPRSSAAAGRAVLENDAGDSTELWDETEAVEAITDHADAWPTEPDSSALGSLRNRLEHWRDVEATS